MREFSCTDVPRILQAACDGSSMLNDYVDADDGNTSGGPLNGH